MELALLKLKVAALGLLGSIVVAACGEVLAGDAGGGAARSPDGGADAPVNADGSPGVVPGGCVPTPELCGDGIDQDCDGVDPPCPLNDTAKDAIDVTGGGTFPGNLNLANADFETGACGDSGGRDVAFKVLSSNPVVYYFDTFGSDFDSVIRIHLGIPCSKVTGNTAPLCADDSCGGVQSQIAARLPAGESCIVVAQKSPTVTKGRLVFNVKAGARDASPVPALVNSAATIIGTTCGTKTFVTTSCDCAKAPCESPTEDAAYFFTVCPKGATLTANTCGSELDTVAFAQAANGNVTTCDVNHAPNPTPPALPCGGQGDSLITQAFGSAGLHFVGVSWSGSTQSPPKCGKFEMAIQLVPLP